MVDATEDASTKLSKTEKLSCYKNEGNMELKQWKIESVVRSEIKREHYRM